MTQLMEGTLMARLPVAFLNTRILHLPVILAALCFLLLILLQPAYDYARQRRRLEQDKDSLPGFRTFYIAELATSFHLSAVLYVLAVFLLCAPLLLFLRPGRVMWIGGGLAVIAGWTLAGGCWCIARKMTSLSWMTRVEKWRRAADNQPG